MNNNNATSEIYSKEHRKDCPFRYYDQDYWMSMNDWENKAFSANESDVEGERLSKYQNWGARGCTHRGHCVGVQERGVLCRNNDYRQQRTHQLSGVTQEWLTGYVPQSENNTSALRAEKTSTATKLDGEVARNCQQKLPRQQHGIPSQTLRSDYFTSPLVYHSAVEARMAPQLFQSQSINTEKPFEKTLKMDSYYLPHGFPAPEPTLPKLNVSESGRKLKKSSAKRLVGPKWKKTYFDTVRNHKKESVGLILVGPDGPEYYAKVSNCLMQSEQPAKKTTSLSALRLERIGAEKVVFTNDTAAGAGDNTVVTIKETEQEEIIPSTGNAELDTEISAKPEVICYDECSNLQASTTINAQSVDCNADDKNEATTNESENTVNNEENQRRVPNLKGAPFQRKCHIKEKDCIHEVKTIYRAKKMGKKLGKSTVSSSTVDNKVDTARTSLMSNFSSIEGSFVKLENNEIQGAAAPSSDSRLQELKEILPNVTGRCKEEHLRQLKIFIKDYVTYLEEKTEGEDLAADSNGRAGVTIDASKLIDVVDRPLQPLSSEMTINMTQTVTDVLVAMDDNADNDPSFFHFLRKTREEKFKKLMSYIVELQELVRVMDTVEALKKPAM